MRRLCGDRGRRGADVRGTGVRRRATTIGSIHASGTVSAACTTRRSPPAAPWTATETLDWSALGAGDVVWFVYPRTAVDGGMLRRYLEAGGRAVLADDFGASDAALAALEIRRLRGELARAPLATTTTRRCRSRARRWRPSCRSASPSVVANHPAFFSAATPPTYAFSPGAALVVEGRLGKGYFVAIADPSVLINNMLEIDENLAFARALIKRTCKPGERIHLVTQSFVARGEPSGNLSPAGPSDSPFVRFNRMLTAIDEVLHAAIYGRTAGLVRGAARRCWRSSFLALVAGARAHRRPLDAGRDRRRAAGAPGRPRPLPPTCGTRWRCACRSRWACR